jgi:hypothetical protein
MQGADSGAELVMGTGRDRAVAQTPVAFLVDGDNASARLIKEMLAEASKYGVVIIRRVYGDWTSTQLASWKGILQEHAIHPVQQFANVSGKNATDSAMIIDAMDILHSGLVKGFCLVSSDSDYTRLATRIREAGLFVIGMGRSETPEAFQRACHIFVSIENLVPTSLPPSESVVTERTAQVRAPIVTPVAPLPRLPPSEALDFLKRAFDSIDPGDGLVHLANLGSTLYRLDPAFDPRTYGKAKLADLIQAFPDIFSIERRTELGPGAVYVRRKRT